MDNDLFSTKPAELEFDPESNYVEQLVGEGKKFTDPNKLAFGKLQSDQFIERLKQENESMRKELLSRQRLEEIVTKLEPKITNQQSASNENNQGSERLDGETKPTTMSGLTPEQAEALITQKMREKENFDRSLNAVKEAYGDNYQTKLDAEAKRLGLSAEDVNKLAKTNTDLFVQIFKGTNTTPSDNYTPSSSINTTSLSSHKPQLTINGIKTEQYYRELKAKDPVAYRSPAIQKQEMQDAIKLGVAFFNAP